MSTNPDDATSAWLESLGVSLEKPATLGEQVRDAQRTMRSWSKEKRESVQLEGQAIGCGQSAPRKPPRHTEWRDTPPRFVGYCARVETQACESCGTRTDLLLGIFAEERTALGASRFLALSTGAQWPQGVDHKLQRITRRVPWCAHCVRGLGFTKEEEL